MPSKPTGKPPATPPGASRGERWLAVGLVAACIGGIGYYALHGSAPAREGDNRPGQASSTDAAVSATAHAAANMPQKPTAGAGATRARPAPDDMAGHVAPGQPAPSMREVIERLHQAGIRTGLGAFNPPGTSPPLVGLAVPEDYVLPEGYVRHHQATDDGQAIEPILMYSPDYDFVDAAGQPLAIPADRVVRAAHAPPGLPIRPVRIPPPRTTPGSAP